MASLARVGRWFFAASLVAFAVLQLVSADLLAETVPAWPEWLPGRAFVAYLSGFALIAAAVLIAGGSRTWVAAASVGIAGLVFAVLRHVPIVAANPFWGAKWTNAAMATAVFGGAFVIAQTSLPAGAAGREGFPGLVARLAPLGRFFLALPMVVFGVQHYLYPQFVTAVVPGWIPGKLFWTYFTGAALVAAGVGIALGVLARWAALLLGLMVFAWVVLLHLPRVAASPGNPGEWKSLFLALAVSGIALVLASRVPPAEAPAAS